MSDFPPTIDSDDDELPQRGESSKRTINAPANDDLDPDFHFDLEGGGELGVWEDEEVVDGTGFDLDDLIAKKRKIRPGESDDEIDIEEEDEEVDEDGDDEEEEDLSDDEEGEDMDDGSEESDSDQDMSVDGEDELAVQKDGSDDDSDEEETNEADEARKAAFFSEDPTTSVTASHSFSSMNLSRPLLRALTSLSLTIPTPIQSRAIPLALLGRDILGSAETGSGKTAAFMIPLLERLCYRDRGKGGQACRVLILCPTRELAVQCEAVGKSLASAGGLDIRFALLVGGLSLNAQAHTLRTLPDVLIATPGRLIDHLTNTPSFTLSALDILVIDEADRMLEAGFTDELTEIIKACPRSRQTMLFSATMTDSVDELVRLSLDKPIRVFVDNNRTAKSLTQEFVRIRSETSRSPSLLTLCKRTVHSRCIIFFRSKALAHQMRIVFGLCGLKAAELHGNLTQEQRLAALTSFKSGKVDYLLATDLASRGLDIKGVETVINYDMPTQLSQYTHRVGRTARAGRKGRSISLIGEADRKMLKAAIKQSSADSIRSRVIPPEAVSIMSTKLDALKDDISAVLKEEKEEKALKQGEMELRKGQNMIEHEKEIFGRPARTWFQTEKEKKASKDALKPGNQVKDERPAIKRGKYDGLSRRMKRRKMAMEQDEKDVASAKAIRAAKKSARPVKITHEGMRAKQVKVNLTKTKTKPKRK